MRDELTYQIGELKKTIVGEFDQRIKDAENENERLKKENLEIKSAISAQQKFLERIRSEKTANHIFMSGIPMKMNIIHPETEEEIESDDANSIITHILKFVNPNIKPEDFKILKSFNPRKGQDRHSAKILCSSNNIKKNIFQGCKKFKDVDAASPLKKVFLKNEDTPLQKKENDRLFKKMRDLREEEEDVNNPVNIYKIRFGKLLKNDEVIDTFNLENQLFT